MARIHTDGRYLKITGIADDKRHIFCEIWPSEEKRLSGIDENWEKIKEVNVHVLPLESLLNDMADPEKSIWDNIYTAAYNALKVEPQWTNEDGWSDKI